MVFSLKFHYYEIEYVMGVILDHRMKWRLHVEVLRDKAHGSIAALSLLLRSNLPSRTKLRRHIKSLAQPEKKIAASWGKGPRCGIFSSM